MFILLSSLYFSLQVYTPTTTTSLDTAFNPTDQSDSPVKPSEPQSNYRDKYKHLIATEIAEPASMKNQPERNFGFGE